MNCTIAKFPFFRPGYRFSKGHCAYLTVVGEKVNASFVLVKVEQKLSRMKRLKYESTSVENCSTFSGL